MVKRSAVKTNDVSFDMSGLTAEEPANAPAAAPAPRPRALPAEVQEAVQEAMPDVVEEKRKLVLTLGRYRTSRFARYLQDLNYKLEDRVITKLSLEELQLLLKDVQFSCANKNNSNMLEPMVLGGVSFVERLVSDFYDVRGLSSNLAKNEAFLEILEEIQLKSLVFQANDPETRLLICVLKTAYMTNCMNEATKRLAAQQSAQQGEPQAAPQAAQAGQPQGGFVLPEQPRSMRRESDAEAEQFVREQAGAELQPVD